METTKNVKFKTRGDYSYKPKTSFYQYEIIVRIELNLKPIEPYLLIRLLDWASVHPVPLMDHHRSLAPMTPMTY